MVFPEISSHPGAAVLLLHAHPDDETLATGGLMARLVAEGFHVVLVTGTRGERGEVVPGPLKHLEGTDALVPTRVAELAAAMRALGVSDHRFLGSGTGGDTDPAVVYSDSGMQWGPTGSAIAADDAPTNALSLAPLDVLVTAAFRDVGEVQPRVIVSYDENGGYGHPDHVRMHDLAVAVSQATGIPLYTVVAEWNGASSPSDSDIVVALDAYRGAKFAALAAHVTQLTVDGDDVVLSGGQRHAIPDSEVFRRYRTPR